MRLALVIISIASVIAAAVLGALALDKPRPLHPELLSARRARMSARIIVGLVLIHLPMLSPSYGNDHLGAQSIWNRYLLAMWNGSALVFLTTTIFWGFNW